MAYHVFNSYHVIDTNLLYCSFQLVLAHIQIWTKYEIVTWLLDHKDVVYSLSQVFLFLITEQATLKTGCVV